MSVLPAQIDVTIVDSATTMKSLLDSIVDLAIDPPSLYLDLEGVRLGRNGSISIISLFLSPLKKIYLIDIHVLGKAAFSVSSSSSLDGDPPLSKPSLNPPPFPSHFQISIDGVEDLQLMELGTRMGSKRLVAGLAKCIQKDSRLSLPAKADWQRTKDGASRLYDPKKGGQYEIFNERPMRAEIIQYFAQDIALLPSLYTIYNRKLSRPGELFWKRKVDEATMDRIKLSQSANYDGQASDKVFGPWDVRDFERDREIWNDNIMSQAING